MYPFFVDKKSSWRRVNINNIADCNCQPMVNPDKKSSNKSSQQFFLSIFSGVFCSCAAFSLEKNIN